MSSSERRETMGGFLAVGRHGQMYSFGEDRVEAGRDPAFGGLCDFFSVVTPPLSGFPTVHFADAAP